MADRPYQAMAVYQRSRHNAQKGEYWPDKPESAPAVSRYPNILPSLESGKPVTYAAYRWACINLQDVLDGEERKATRQRQTRTGELPSVKIQKVLQTKVKPQNEKILRGRKRV